MDKKEMYWDCDSNIARKFLSEFKRLSHYNNFRFKYDWKEYPEIEDYLLRLMYCSFARNKDIRNDLQELIHDVEDFFYQSISQNYINKSNIDNVLSILKDKNSGLRAIEPLPEKGLYGKSVGDIIQINLNMTKHPNSPQLTPRELTKLYMFHEIGHKVLKVASNYVAIENYLDTLEEILKSKGVNNPDTYYKYTVYHGFLMIEECLVQELAEQLTYRSSNKKRMPYNQRIEIASIQGEEYEVCEVPTNLDFYGIFQMPTIEFGKTLRGCYNSSSTNERILSRMIMKALNSDFPEEVFREYYEGNGTLYQDLFSTLRAMGMIKIQKYATFGQDTPLKGITTESCLNAISYLTSRNQDMRTYPAEGYKEIDYEFFKQKKKKVNEK
jgi:hypothetical protein